MREVNYNNSKALRIVDFIGIDDDLAGIGNELRRLIKEKNYEYIDFYEYGIPDNIMISAGFTLKKSDDFNIIPNYFEPFVLRNIQLNYSTTDESNLYVFKADSDQDRPNSVGCVQNL